MRVLVFTTLYPNTASPNHGVFVENRVRQLIAHTGAEVRVVAPVPWFPFTHARFGAWGRWARAPRREVRHGIEVLHPRYPVIPKVGTALQPALLFAWTRRSVGRLLRRFPADVIDAHYLYPDGVAAVLLGRTTGVPVTLTARGNDLTLLPRYRLPRRWLRWAVARADGLAAVCAAFRHEYAKRLGVDPARVVVLRNGVDLETFTPRGETALTDPHAGDRRVLLSVGQLIPRKGHDLTIAALARLPADVVLAIAGTGPERGRLEALAVRLGVDDRVRFLGSLPHSDLPAYYRGATLSVLASHREGWANVLLESLACGTPVVATAVSGTPEVIEDGVAGRLVHDRTAASLASAVGDVLSAPPGRAEVRAYAERFAWPATSAGQMAQFDQIVNRRGEQSPGGDHGER